MRRSHGGKMTGGGMGSSEEMRGTHSFRLMRVGLLLFLTLWVGCSGGGTSTSIPDKRNPSIATKRKSEPPKPAVKTEQKEEKEYVYNSAGKPDPFKPFIQLSSGKDFKNTPLTPLQKYDISQLKLVAVIVSPKGNIALVEDSLGKGYFLKNGTRVGRNDGKVKQIVKDRVIVEEVEEDITTGQRKNKETLIILNRLEEGGES